MGFLGELINGLIVPYDVRWYNKFFGIIFIVLTTKMASMSRGCKPRIFSFENWSTKYSQNFVFLVVKEIILVSFRVSSIFFSVNLLPYFKISNLPTTLSESSVFLLR